LIHRATGIRPGKLPVLTKHLRWLMVFEKSISYFVTERPRSICPEHDYRRMSAASLLYCADVKNVATLGRVAVWAGDTMWCAPTATSKARPNTASRSLPQVSGSQHRTFKCNAVTEGPPQSTYKIDRMKNRTLSGKAGRQTSRTTASTVQVAFAKESRAAQADWRGFAQGFVRGTQEVRAASRTLRVASGFRHQTSEHSHVGCRGRSSRR
jgi:hypothetical protein